MLIMDRRYHRFFPYLAWGYTESDPSLRVSRQWILLAKGAAFPWV